MPRLSICIPTYNRAAFLAKLLSITFRKNFRDVEVVISDNNSTDDTAAIVKKFQKRYANIVYSKNPTNIGFDANLLKVVSLASGDYCWVLGDDDVLYSHAIATALGYTRSGDDCYLIGVDLYTLDMRFISNWQYLQGVREGETFNMASQEDMLNYLSHVRANAGLFGYIGGFIFKRKYWGEIVLPKSLKGLGWAHVYMMWSFKNFQAKLKYFPRPLVKLRTQNDTTTKEKSFIARFTLEYKGLYLTALKLFGEDSPLFNAFLMSIVRYIRPWAVPPLFILRGQSKKDWPELAKWIKKYPYKDSFKKSLNSPFRINPLYFLRLLVNKPYLKWIKKPFKLAKDFFIP
ncbi:MAG: glycosyltransferase family 2 protein [Elusimicrobiota bacterium]|jgi:abequosyltransferase|nr:glycosyltransferase family 2 protein [Elusimicrobiota bacterium]